MRTADELAGRDSEGETLRELVSTLPLGGTARILRGPVGVGKSALLALAGEEAEGRGTQVSRTGAVRAEMGLPWAGLHQILRPLLEQADGLARHHRAVLMSGFGGPDESRSDTFSIALATLELFAEAAKRTPVLILVDDAHWLDSETVRVLGFVGRRLAREPVGLLLAIRDGYPTDLPNFGFPEIDVRPLDEPSSEAVVAATAPEISGVLKARVMAEAAGNPLALVELSTATPSDRPVFGRPQALPTSRRLRRAFADRFLDLPVPTRALLLLMSLDRETTVNEALHSIALIGDGPPPTARDLVPAIESGLVDQMNSRLWFRHPLTPVVIYEVSSSDDRQRAHAALATALADRPDRRAWHRAAAVTAPDERVAQDLESVAAGTANENRLEWRIDGLERAAELSVEPLLRNRRLVRAAELSLEHGDRRRTARLLGEIKPEGCDIQYTARAQLLRETLEGCVGADPRTADSLLARAAEVESSGPKGSALPFLRAAAVASWWGGLGPEVRSRISAAARVAAQSDDAPELLAILSMSDPDRALEAILAVSARTPPPLCDVETAFALGTALHYVGAFDRSAPYLREAIRALRDQARVWRLPEALALQAWNRIFVDNLNAASTAADEAVLLARDLRQPLWEAMSRIALSLVHALRGSTGDAESILRAAEGIAVPMRARAVLADAQFARAIIALADGSYDEAFEHLEQTLDPRDASHHYQRSAGRIGELAEAAVQAGRVDEARPLVARWGDAGRFERPPVTRLEVGLLYARALLAADEDAEAGFEAALHEDLSSWPLYRARLQLHYGMWLRRRRRISQARMPLRAARDSLAALGATVWVERAQQELRASRERQHCGPDARLELTEQELQIARMAARGLSNREIAQRLYISPRTVGSHLYRIYPKLGVASRLQLPLALDDRESTDVA